MGSTVGDVAGRRGILAREAAHPLDLNGRFAVAISLIIVNVVDVVTTRLLIGMGGQEVNPLAARLIGAGELVPVKMAVVGLVGVLIVVAPLRRRAEQVLGAVALVYAAVLVSHLAQLVGVLAAR